MWPALTDRLLAYEFPFFKLSEAEGMAIFYSRIAEYRFFDLLDRNIDVILLFRWHHHSM